MRRFLLFIAFMSGTSFLAFSQQTDSIQAVEFHPGFQFEPGIYLTADDWKKNDPIAVKQVVTTLDPSSPSFFADLFRSGSFRYIKSKDEVAKVPTDDIFGYSDGDDIFYGTNLKFEIIGAICLLREIELVDTYSSYINPGEKEYRVSRNEYSGKKYLMNYLTGKKFKYKRKYFEDMLEHDPELFLEYKEAGGKKKEKMVIYLKKYNERNPVYFIRQNIK